MPVKDDSNKLNEDFYFYVGNPALRDSRSLVSVVVASLREPDRLGVKMKQNKPGLAEASFLLEVIFNPSVTILFVMFDWLTIQLPAFVVTGAFLIKLIAFSE